jgi:ATP adenylyltransferase
MPEFNRNIWTPWRMAYIDALEGKPAAGDCFLCRYREAPSDDESNGVLWRTARTLVVLNRFPYTNGHLMVAPTAHVGAFEDLADDVLCEMTLRLRDAKRVLGEVVGAQGFNIGINLGHCAGAGLPEHVHWHIVPRWVGDTNFMAILDDVRLIPQALTALREKFLAAAARLGLPR